MEEYFDNSQVINSIRPNGDRISELRFQRNLAIGVCFVFVSVISIVYYIKIKEEKKERANSILRPIN